MAPAGPAGRDRVVAAAPPTSCCAPPSATTTRSLFYEHKALYGRKGPVDARRRSPRSARPRSSATGSDVTIVATLLMVERALAAAETLAAEGIDAEVIDLRWLRPLDLPTVRGLGRARPAGSSSPRSSGTRPAGARRSSASCPSAAWPGQGTAAPRSACRTTCSIPYSPPLEDEVLPSAERDRRRRPGRGRPVTATPVAATVAAPRRRASTGARCSSSGSRPSRCARRSPAGSRAAPTRWSTGRTIVTRLYTARRAGVARSTTATRTTSSRSSSASSTTSWRRGSSAGRATDPEGAWRAMEPVHQRHPARPGPRAPGDRLRRHRRSGTSSAKAVGLPLHRLWGIGRPTRCRCSVIGGYYHLDARRRRGTSSRGYAAAASPA